MRETTLHHTNLENFVPFHYVLVCHLFQSYTLCSLFYSCKAIPSLSLSRSVFIYVYIYTYINCNILRHSICQYTYIYIYIVCSILDDMISSYTMTLLFCILLDLLYNGASLPAQTNVVYPISCACVRICLYGHIYIYIWSPPPPVDRPCPLN